MFLFTKNILFTNKITMLKNSDVIDMLSKKVYLTRKDSKLILESLVSIIVDEIKAQGKVIVKVLWTFKYMKTKPRRCTGLWMNGKLSAWSSKISFITSDKNRGI